jgi:hypothetical protein
MGMHFYHNHFLDASSGKDRSMTNSVKYGYAALALLFATSPSYADSCEPLIAGVQAKVDAAIERHAGDDRWRHEGLDATLSRQPSPFSLAATEGERGADLEVALESLDRARAADRVGDVAVCRRELASARAILWRHHQR